jgi:hypothetical protein
MTFIYNPHTMLLEFIPKDYLKEHPRVEACCVSQILSGRLISRATGYSVIRHWLGEDQRLN